MGRLDARVRWRAAAALAPALLAGCGSGDASPSGPSDTPAGPTHEAVAIVYYDENGNGQLDASEGGRLPDVVVEVAGRTGRSERGNGRASITGVPAGNQSISIRAGSLPAFFRAGNPVSVTIPQEAGRDVLLPVTLAIGSNRPNVYMAFGDSITDGAGSSDDDGYRGLLERRLVAHMNRANVLKNGASGTTSSEGALRISRNLRDFRPAYLLILYGTNDWNTGSCNSNIATCFTGVSIQTIIRSAKDVGSLPVVSTIIPANTGFNSRAPQDRNERVQQQNDQIRAVARAEGVPVAESYQAFERAAGGSFRSLFVDHVHPNDRGFELIAQSFFEAITRAAAASAGLSEALPLVGFARPAGRAQRPPRGGDGG